MPEYRLTKEIIDRSVSSNLDEERLEWELSEACEVDEPETCLCGRFPIIEYCVLSNVLNMNCSTVGGCCVKKFIGLLLGKIFKTVKRVRKGKEQSLNAESINHAYRSGWINEYENIFYLYNKRKTNFTPEQRA